MTQSAIIYDADTGEILRVITVKGATIALPDGTDFMLGEADDETEYVSGGEVIDRPTLPAPASGAAPVIYDITGYPEGTVLTVTNESDDELRITAFGEPLTLTDPGRYRLRAAPPFPWIELDTEVIVA